MDQQIWEISSMYAPNIYVYSHCIQYHKTTTDNTVQK